MKPPAIKMSSEENPTSVEVPSGGRPVSLHSIDDEELLGATLNETYVIERMIGEGGMSRVYEAKHTRISHKRYALKVLNSELSRNQELLERFKREAEAVASIRHDNIVDIYDVGVTPRGIPFLVCEFLDGRDLSVVLTDSGRLSPLVATRIARKVASALAVAHERGVVHRDLKPENIFLLGDPADPIVKVIDFGLSRFVDGSRTTMTRAGVVMGTPSYMSPEQARGERTDHRTDIYGVGAILYTCVTGHPPFEEESAQQTILAVMGREPPRPRSLEPSVPESVELLIQRAMARDHQDRYQSMTDLEAALTTLEEQLDVAPSRTLHRPPQMSALALENAADAKWGRLRLALLTVVAIFVAFAVMAMGAAGAATWIAGQPLTSTELILVMLGVLGTAGTPIALMLLRMRRRVWHNSAKVVDTVAELRAPLISAVAAYGGGVLVLRGLRYVKSGAFALGWVGWDVALFVLVVLWTIVAIVRRKIVRWRSEWGKFTASAALIGAGVLLSLLLFGAGAGWMVPPIAALTPRAVPTTSAEPASSAEAPRVKDEPGPGAEASAAPPANIPRAPDAELSAAMREGANALEQLAGRFPKDPQVLRAWAVAAADEGALHGQAITAFKRLFEEAPKQAADEALRPLLIKLAHGDESAAALDMIANDMGSAGPDLLFDLMLTSRAVREEAKKRLDDSAVRKRFSPALSVAYDLRTAPSCAARIGFLPRAKKYGDNRAIQALTLYSMTRKRGCGKWKRKPCAAICAREASAFRSAIVDIQKRLDAQATPKKK
jgi:serine/threonine-protein kinase